MHQPLSQGPCKREERVWEGFQRHAYGQRCLREYTTELANSVIPDNNRTA